MDKEKSNKLSFILIGIIVIIGIIITSGFYIYQYIEANATTFSVEGIEFNFH